MTEAVIVATARTPIGRAGKGSLKDMRPDDLSAGIIAAVLDKVPELDRTEIEDVLWGCGQPAVESGHNIGRVSAVLAADGSAARRSVGPVRGPAPPRSDGAAASTPEVARNPRRLIDRWSERRDIGCTPESLLAPAGGVRHRSHFQRAYAPVPRLTSLAGRSARGLEDVPRRLRPRNRGWQVAQKKVERWA